MGRVLDVVPRNDPVVEDVLVVVDVVQEKIQRDDPLREPGLEVLPFARGNHPRDGIERKDPLRALVVAVDVEGDALPQKMLVAGRPPRFEIFRLERREPFEQSLIMGSHAAISVEHLVEKTICLVGFKHVNSWGQS